MKFISLNLKEKFSGPLFSNPLLFWNTGLEQIVKIAKEQGWFDKFIDYFTKKHNVLMLGCSGAGKTELIKSLESLNPEIIHYTSRTRDKSVSGLKINKVPFEFIDVPGEEHDISIRNDAIIEYKHDLDAIINVVSYGYHEYTYGKEDAILNEAEVSENYLIWNRKREMDTIPEWSVLLGGSLREYRLITVVTKADLWWPNSKTILSHYQHGDYYKSLGSAQQLKPMVVPYCSVIKKFYDKTPTSGQFDESSRIIHRNNLLRTLVEVVGKGGNKK